MNKKYLLTAKNLFQQCYIYLIVAIILAYNGYICYFVYNNLNAAYQAEEKNNEQIIINTVLYEKIIEQKKAKQSPSAVETNKNPFNL